VEHPSRRGVLSERDRRSMRSPSEFVNFSTAVRLVMSTGVSVLMGLIFEGKTRSHSHDHRYPLQHLDMSVMH